MSATNERSIRTIQFSGKTKDWRMWSKQFLALSGKREYKDILLGTVSPPPDSDVLDLSTDAGKAKLAARKANDNAYHDLILANQTKVAFNIIDKSISTDLPNGYAFAAWKNLTSKYDSKSTVKAVTLSEQYNSSKLNNTKTDPETWIVYLEILQSRLNDMKYQVSDNHLMIHILLNLPEEYDTLVETMEKELNNSTDPLTIEGMKERLHAKWERMNRRNGDDNDDDENNEEALFMAKNNEIKGEALFGKKQFKGRCRICGKIGHKGADCFLNPKNKYSGKSNVGSEEIPFGSYGSGFRGRCNYCKEPGHISKYCKKLKMKNEKKALIAKEIREKKTDVEEISLFAILEDEPIEDDEENEDEAGSLPELLINEDSDEESIDEDTDEETTPKTWKHSPYPWIEAEIEMYRQANYTFPEASVPRQELEDEKLVEQALMASRDEMKELVSDDESSSYDSWKERTVYTDDSLPYEGMVRSSSEEEKSAIIQDEPEQLYTS